MGALLSAASCTRATIRLYCESSMRAVTRIRTAASPFSEPLMRPSPADRSTGRLSPVSEDSSKEPDSESRTPSSGTTSPGLTSRMSPISTSAAATSSCWLSVWVPAAGGPAVWVPAVWVPAAREPLRSRWAVCGTRSSNAVSSPLALPAA